MQLPPQAFVAGGRGQREGPVLSLDGQRPDSS